MAAIVTERQWVTARTALDETGERFLDLLRTAPDADAKATEDWTIAEVAAHVTVIASLYVDILRSGGEADETEVHGEYAGGNIDTVGAANADILDRYTERDQHKLAAELRGHLDTILELTARDDPARPIRWLGDSRIPVAGLLAHLVNELQLHGLDLAGALGARWTVRPEEAALFLEVFLINMLRLDTGRMMEKRNPGGNGRLAVELRSRHIAPVTVVLANGTVTAEPPGGRVDAVLRFTPFGLNQLLFGRIGKAQAALTGKVFPSGGRRPWRLGEFLRTLRMP